MSATLAESIDLLLPHLSPTLAASDAASGLTALASKLAPILRGGFECRLSANAPQVDLQQCIINTEATLLKETGFLRKSWPNHPAWAHLQDFLTEWALPSSKLYEGVPEIWLELDSNTSSYSALPAVFFGLPEKVSVASETYPIAAIVLDLLLGKSGWCEWQENLYRCFATCPDGVFISHVGAMLSRSRAGLRVNIKRLLPDSLIPYLQQVGCQEPTDKLEALMKQLFAKVDRITVCLDVGSKIYPQIGLECIFLKQPQDEPRWVTFLDYLVEQNLCASEKRDALLDWPGQSTPTNTKVVWPASLIAASLLQPSDRFTVFDRQLSHIKIVYQPQRLLEAKGYLWFQHQWLFVERKR